MAEGQHRNLPGKRDPHHVGATIRPNGYNHPTRSSIAQHSSTLFTSIESSSFSTQPIALPEVS